MVPLESSRILSQRDGGERMAEGSHSFDYLIVGAGSAGCVLAYRLSADGASVLVLEAGGPDKSWLIHVPLGVGKVWNGPRFNWSYSSDPEPNLGGREMFHPRGKVLGGSSSINMMAYVRGHRGDFDRWRQMGLDGWAFADVLPYFKRAETFEDPHNDFHGSDGPLTVEISRVDDALVDIFLEAAQQAGYALTPDYNGARQEGFARLQLSVRNGRRCSAAVAYLHPAVAQGGVALETGGHVTRVLFEGDAACGVEYFKDGRIRTARAEHEVILAGGAFNSPQLLMISGIGPAGHLAEIGVETRLDRQAVGGNLQDHPAIANDYRYAERSKFHRELRLDRLSLSMVRAHLFRTGFASIAPSSATAFVKSGPEAELPDIQLFFRSASMDAREWFPLIKKPAPETFTFRACHLRPESRGSIRLRSADPREKVRIRNNFLATETDRRVLRDCLRVMRTLARQPAFDPVRGEEVLPGPGVETEEEMDAFIRDSLGTVFHPIGTCRMGADPDSVVDGQMRVRGIERLRVVDASVMPDLVGGNINAVVIMIAEKAADLILGKPAPAPIEI